MDFFVEMERWSGKVGVEISVKMKNYLDISLNALQAIGTATRKEQTSAHAWHISTPSNPKK